MNTEIKAKINEALSYTWPIEGGRSAMVATFIVDLLLPTEAQSLVAAHYRSKEVAWLTLIIAAEGLTCDTLSERVQSLANVSSGIAKDLGAISGRLQMACQG